MSQRQPPFRVARLKNTPCDPYKVPGSFYLLAPTPATPDLMFAEPVGMLPPDVVETCYIGAPLDIGLGIFGLTAHDGLPFIRVAYAGPAGGNNELHLLMRTMTRSCQFERSSTVMKTVA